MTQNPWRVAFIMMGIAAAMLGVGLSIWSESWLMLVINALIGIWNLKMLFDNS